MTGFDLHLCRNDVAGHYLKADIRLLHHVGRFAPHFGRCRRDGRCPEADKGEAEHRGTFAPEAAIGK
ncbi:MULTISPECIES: hypothetical protein [unclassified Mesorhizobium]|uniref:hypothetical protein n=1 Tax=unclassified Mesorhizobium TaxID=325217 RepID=UPI000FEA5FBB|nr:MULTISPECIES: hypothetical protein [unclassified Mesorhizobium]RWQ18880.1 MAG: hypothetical protein EOR93_18525 [Mesorhizobium sp.]